jgi:hypothetical protein
VLLWQRYTTRRWLRRKQNINTNKMSREEMLYLPDFESDAVRLVNSLQSKRQSSASADDTGDNATTEEDDKPTLSPQMKQQMVNELINARIDALSGLFRPRCSNFDVLAATDVNRSSMKVRASDLTDAQLVDWVLNGACGERFLEKYGLSDKAHVEGDIVANGFGHANVRTTNNSIYDVQSIHQQYIQRRQDQRSMVQSYLQSARQRGRFPLLHDEDVLNNAQAVHVDRYGRLVRRQTQQQQPAVDGENRQANANGMQEGEDELEDASNCFWRDKAIADLWRRNKLNGISISTSAVMSREGFMPTQPAATANQQPPVNNMAQHNPPFLPLQHHNQQAIRNLTEQMERDATAAIARALERYRLQERQSWMCRDASIDDGMRHNDDGEGEDVYELVEIPLVRREHVNNQTRQLHFWPFNRHRRDGDANNNEADNVQEANAPQIGVEAANNELRRRREQQHQRNQRNHRAEHNHVGGGGWLDLRLAFRRICFAVLTVAAAFACTMLQGLHPVDFGDDAVVYMDGAEIINGLWFSGLLGPHFHGHHHRNTGVSSLSTLRRTRWRGREVQNDPFAQIERFFNLMYDESYRQETMNDNFMSGLEVAADPESDGGDHKLKPMSCKDPS